MSQHILLPAIRSYVGDWIFYTTTLTFEEVNQLVKTPDEVHERQRLSEWIQREAIESHSEAISRYIIENPQRFLGSLIIGLYDGNPNWSPLSINFSYDHLDLSESQKDSLEGKLGILLLSGEEKLFPIDGQHRVAGIKKIFSESEDVSDLKNDSINAIFVSHDASSDLGKQRTRRLFTTLNKKAKPVSTAATIALDEDNGFAIVTRRLIDEYWLFEDERRHISYTSSGAINPDAPFTITSVVGLYNIIKDLYGSNNKKDFENTRPNDNEIDDFLKKCKLFWDLLIDKVPEYHEVFVARNKQASFYRSQKSNHLLFRPIGQRVLARCSQLLITRNHSIEESINKLLNVDFYTSSGLWDYILWNPIDENMITNKIVVAETRLLSLVDESARTRGNASKLQELLRSIESSNSQ